MMSTIGPLMAVAVLCAAVAVTAVPAHAQDNGLYRLDAPTTKRIERSIRNDRPAFTKRPAALARPPLEQYEALLSTCDLAEAVLPGSTSDPQAATATEWVETTVNVTRRYANYLARKGHIVVAEADAHVVNGVIKNPNIQPVVFHNDIEEASIAASAAAGSALLADWGANYCATHPDPAGFAHHIAKFRTCAVSIPSSTVVPKPYPQANARYTGCYDPTSTAHKPIINWANQAFEAVRE